MKRRTIAVVTGTRAEFGLLATVIRAVASHSRLNLKLIVTGTHLTTGTWKDVASQFRIDAKVPMQKRGVVGRAADVEALGRGVIGLGKVFAAMKPDFVVVLGDRIEAFAAASAASVGGVRVAHLHGGDRAEGVADEAMRHAISKLSHLHLPATALSRERLIKMGEPGEHVFEVGSPAVDGLGHVRPLPPGPRAIVLQHPIGGSDRQEGRWMMGTLRAAMKELDGDYITLGPNSDPGSSGVRHAILRFQRRPPLCDRRGLPRRLFLSTLVSMDMIVGNSSAGLIEAAALKIPCVNIGPRQNGREKPANVIDCDYGEDNVRRAIRKALNLDLRRMKHPYGDGRTGERVAKILAEIDLERMPGRKRNSY